MTLENDSQSSTAADEAVVAVTKPARRRAVRKAAPAQSAEQVETPSATDVAAVPAETAPADVTTPAKKAPRSRRAVRSTTTVGSSAPAAPEPVAAVEAPAVQATAVAPEVAAPVQEPAPVKRSGSRRVTRSAAPTSQAVGAEPAGAGSVAAEPVAVVPAASAPAAEAPAAPVTAPRSRSRKKAVAPVAVTAPEEPTDEDVVADEPAEATAAPRLAMTALLFQAPDPAAARTRRRRASTPAGSPEAVSEAAGAAHEAPAADAVTTVTVDDGVQDAPARSRRSRRGAGSAASNRAAEAVEELLGETPAPALVTAGAADEEIEDEVSVDDAEDNENEGADGAPRRRRRRGGRGRRGRSASEIDETPDQPADGTELDEDEDAVSQDAGLEDDETSEDEGSASGSRRRRRRRRSGRGGDSDGEQASTSGGGGSTRSRQPRPASDEVTALRGSTRLEAKRQRRREGRDAGRRRTVVTESEFLSRRESVDRSMVVREVNGLTQIAVLEDGVLVEHYISSQAKTSMAGNVYLGRVQNVLPSMEAAFVDVGKGRNAVLYAGEVNWDAAGMDGQPRRIEQALKSGDSVLVQVTKDPIGHKGARLTSQITLAGRYLVYVPGGGMTGISRKLPEPERARLKKLLREIVPDTAGVIVRTAAEGASEDELRADIARLQDQWTAIEKKVKSASAPALLQGEPDLAIRVVRDIFNDDFRSLVVQGGEAWETISGYISALAPDLAAKVSRWTGNGDVFAEHRVDEQLAKALGRKVWLPSGGSLVIDKTEAMTVIDVNTGKFVGSGGTLEETVTRNNLEAAEEIVRQLRLRDVGGIIVVDFIDMVLESNRDLVMRRLLECLGRDRTKHQVAEVTSLGLVQMTRKRVGQGLAEAFADTTPGQESSGAAGHEGTGAQASELVAEPTAEPKRSRRKRGGAKEAVEGTGAPVAAVPVLPEAREAVKATLATIAAAAAHAHEHDHEGAGPESDEPTTDVAGSEPHAAPAATTGDPTAIPTFDLDLSLVQVDAEVFELDGDEDNDTGTDPEDAPAV